HPATSNTDPQRYSACAAESPMNGTAAVQGEKRLRDRVVPEEFRMGCEATPLTQPAETAKARDQRHPPARDAAASSAFSGCCACPSVSLQFVMQRDTINPQFLGSATLVLAAFLQHSQDVYALNFVKGLTAIDDRLHLQAEILVAQCGLLRHHHRSLNCIFEFPDISRPWLLLQLVHGAGQDLSNAFVH